MKCGECKDHFGSDQGRPDDDDGEGLWYCNACWKALDPDAEAGGNGGGGGDTECQQCKKMFSEAEGDFDGDVFYCNPCWDKADQSETDAPPSPAKQSGRSSTPNNVTPQTQKTQTSSGGTCE